LTAPPLHAPAGYDCPFCIYGLARELAGEVHETARRIAFAMKAASGCDGISTRQHNEPPRYDDLYRSPYRLTTAEERRSYAERLVGALG
jgi:histidine triad (HIT) family protein